MFKSMDRAWRNMCLVVAAFGAIVIPQVVYAQVAGEDTFENPRTLILDSLGIDIAGDQYVRDDTPLTIGDPAHGGLAWTYHGHTHLPSLTADYTGSVGSVTDELGNTYKQVTIGENETSFDTSYNNLSGTSATLTSGGIFTDVDGTIYTFVSGALSTIQKPDGTVLTIYSQSVVSNRGYAFKFDSANNKVWAVNMATHNCDAQAVSCDAYDSFITLGSYVDTGGKEWGTITDAAGNVWQYQVSSMFMSGSVGKGTKIRRPPGIFGFKSPNGYFATIVRRTSDGCITSFTDPRGTFTFTWDASRNLTVTDPSGATLYSAVISWADTVCPSVDSTVTILRDGLGRATNYSYINHGDRWLLQTITRPEGNGTTYTYDSRSNVVQITSTPKSGSGLSAINVYANYDATCTNLKTCNKPNWTEDARGNYTYYTYDSTHGGVNSVTLPADSAGYTPKTITTWTQYTAQIKNSSGGWISAGAIWLPSLVSSCAKAVTCDGDAKQLKTTNNYNVYGNLLPSSVTVAAGDNSVSQTSTFTYDAVGNKTSVDGPRTDVSDVSYTTYDAIHRPVYEIGVDPDGSGLLPHIVAHHIYTGTLETQTEAGTSPNTDGSSFTRTSYMTTSFDAMEHKTLAAAYIDGNSTPQSLNQSNYDNRGRLVCTAVRMNPSIYGTISGTDACSLGTTAGYGPDRITHNNYDLADEVTQVDQAYGVSGTQRAYARYSYTNNGLKQTEMDADGNKTQYVYDGFDRLYQVQYPSTTAGSGSVNTSDYEQYGYDYNGNRTSWRRRDGNTINYGYDNLNRQTLKDIPGGTASDVYTDYDLLGHPCIDAFASDIRASGPDCTSLFSSLSGTSGVHYEYNGLGWLAETADLNGRAVSYGYNEAGVRNELWYPDGHVVAYTLDAANRQTAIGYDTWSGLFSQSYDNLGRIYGQGKAGGSTTYGSDNLGRLTSLSNDLNGSSYDVAWSFSYNPAGQLYQSLASSTAYDYVEPSSGTINNTYDGLNRDAGIAALSGGFDNRGNLTYDGTRTFTYDVENRLLTATSTTSNVKLVYDPLGRLAQYSTDGGATYTDFLYDGVKLIGEYTHGNSTPNERYIFGYGIDDPLVWLHGSGTSDERWFWYDQHGSVIGYSDSSGNLVDLYKYGPYGEPRDASNSINFSGARFRYTGQIAIASAGLYYYKARIYDPIFGRFLQADPIGSKDDLDLYAYTSGDPANHADSTGTVRVTVSTNTIGHVYSLIGDDGEAVASTSTTAADGEALGDVLAACRAGPWGCAVGGAVAAGVLGAQAGHAVESWILRDTVFDKSATDDDDDNETWKTFYHGTSSSDVKSIQGGLLEGFQKSGNHPGFYLAPDKSIANAFAVNTGGNYANGAVITFAISSGAEATLKDFGAHYETNRFSNYGKSFQEFIIPPTAYPVFNAMMESGKIKITNIGAPPRLN